MSEQTIDDRQKTASSELSSLNRVSHRLAITLPERLQQVLQNLLPRLLRRMGENHQIQLQLMRQVQADPDVKQLKDVHDKIHSKLVEMLSHAMKRVRDDQGCQLPCKDILNLLLVDDPVSEEDETKPTESPKPIKPVIPHAKETVDPFCLNLSLAFLTLGVTRLSSRSDVEALLPSLFVLVGRYSGLGAIRTPAKKMQCHQVAHLLLRAIEFLVQDEHNSTRTKPKRNTAIESIDNNTECASHVELSRRVCSEDPRAGAAVFDLLLDCILYEPVAGNVPPNGLSQAGHERLKQGSSNSARDWAAEKAPRMKLMEFKLALLDFISPSRRWAVFTHQSTDLGTSRTVALLVVASGDSNPEVAQRATSYLKMHHDSFRGDQSESSSTTATRTLGDPVCLTCGLLSLALGQTNAETAMSKPSSVSDRTTWLGAASEPSVSSDSAQLVLSLKRRAVSEATAAPLMTYVADKVLAENPQLLNEAGFSMVQQLATLPLLVSQRTLSTLRTSSGLSILQAKAYVAAAELLNLLCIRVAAFYDSALSEIGRESGEEKKEDKGQNSADFLKNLLARALQTACSVLVPVSCAGCTSSSSVLVSNEGSVAIRDACYGVICTLSRSLFAFAIEGFLFVRGKTDRAFTERVSPTSEIDTASLLFGCAANEVDTLRPRAVAALDALLGAYCRVYKESRRQEQQEQPHTSSSIEVDLSFNPWATTEQPSNKESTGSKAALAFFDEQKLTKALLPLLWSASQPSQPKASRVAAARWSMDLLKGLSIVRACHLLCFLAGDSDVTASSIAREGLGLSSRSLGATSDDDDHLPNTGCNNPEGQQHLPSFGELASALFPSQKIEAPSSFWRPQYWDFSFTGKAAALRFGLICFHADFYLNDEDDSVTLFVSVVADSLVRFAVKAGNVKTESHGREAVELLEECSRCLMATTATSQRARLLLVPSGSSDESNVSISVRDVVGLIQTVGSSRARRQLACAYGQLLDDKSIWFGKAYDRDVHAPCMQDWLQRGMVQSALDTCSAKLAVMKTNLSSSTGEIHEAAFLGAQTIRSLRLYSTTNVRNGGSCKKEDELLCWQYASSIITSLGRGTLHCDESVANLCADGLCVALAFKLIDAPILDKRLHEGTASALNDLATALRKFSGSDHTDVPRTLKLAAAAGACLAASTSGAGVLSDDMNQRSAQIGPCRLQCVGALFSLLGSPAYRKDEEIALVTGEALALYADSYSPDSTVWSAPASEWPLEYDEEYGSGLPPHQHVLYTIIRGIYPSNSPHKKTACASSMLGIVSRAAKGVNLDRTSSKRYLVREVRHHMAEVQDLFITLLSNKKNRQIGRESCCLGLAALRGLTNADSNEHGKNIHTDELNRRLLRAFGQTTNHGGSAYQETREQAASRRANEGNERDTTADVAASTIMEQFGTESEVGGASGLSESALNSYKEMASAAVSLGRIDVLYALLILSVSHDIWFVTRYKYKYSAATLLGEGSMVGSRTNSAELRSALRPHLGKLLPRILRACHDPNKQTRDQMTSLWMGVTGGGSEARSAISEHFLPTLDTLIDECSSKLWRARAGACGALSQILVGRSWDELGGGPAVLNDDDVHTKTRASDLIAGVRLLRLFRVAMRALDDVRGNVREAGEKLARTVRGLSIRMCDPSLNEASNSISTKAKKEESISHARNASAASATTLRWLMKNGLNQQCPEATGICLSCLVEIVDIVQPRILQPLIPDLLRSLLFAMSGLEPSALNYLQVRSSTQNSESEMSYDDLERLRIRIAASGPLATAVAKLLDMLKTVSLETQRAVPVELDTVLRQSVGFATRAATADAVAMLCGSCPEAFQFAGVSNTNPSVRLLRALYFASERERGQGARDKMVLALGNLAALCPGSSVRLLAVKACEKYNTSMGNNENPAIRRASAAALRSISVRACNQLSDGGPNDIWFRRVLPVAFLGQRDSDSNISSQMKEVWEECSIAVNLSHAGSEDGFGTIEEKLLPHLVSECCRALDDLSWTRRVAGSAALRELCDKGILSPPPRKVATSEADCYLSLKRSQRRAQASNAALRACIGLLSRSRLWVGKNSVISASVCIASKWSSAVIADEASKKSALGLDKEIGEPCIWQPILVAPGDFQSDLFAGDGWFNRGFEGHTATDKSNEVLQQRSDGDGNDPNEDITIDFDECDKQMSENEDDKLGSDTKDGSSPNNGPLTFSGLVFFLLDQALPGAVSKNLADSEEFLPYRLAAFRGLRDLLNSLDDWNAATVEQKKAIYPYISSRLFSLCDIECRLGLDTVAYPPALVARAIDCIAASLWYGFDRSNDLATRNVVQIANVLVVAGGKKQPSWAVREASFLCLGSLVAHCHSTEMREHKLVSMVVDAAGEAQKDRKFWKVRFAGLKLLHDLVARAGRGRLLSLNIPNGEDQDKQLVLEALLPQKESILKLTRRSLTDPEARITALSSEIIGMMSWWP